MDNALLLDTSVFSIFLKPSSVHAARLHKIQRELANRIVFVSLVTVAELLFWAEKRSWGEKRRTEFDHRVRTFGVLAPTRDDLWIASAALEFNIPILTADNDFDRIPAVTAITS